MASVAELKTVSWKSCGAVWTGKVRFTSKLNGHIFFYVTVVKCSDPKAFVPRGKTCCLNELEILEAV